jgi:hypothetical protein
MAMAIALIATAIGLKATAITAVPTIGPTPMVMGTRIGPVRELASALPFSRLKLVLDGARFGGRLFCFSNTHSETGRDRGASAPFF